MPPLFKTALFECRKKYNIVGMVLLTVFQGQENTKKLKNSSFFAILS